MSESEERDDGTLHIRVGSREPVTNTVRFNRGKSSVNPSTPPASSGRE